MSHRLVRALPQDLLPRAAGTPPSAYVGGTCTSSCPKDGSKHPPLWASLRVLWEKGIFLFWSHRPGELASLHPVILPRGRSPQRDRGRSPQRDQDRSHRGFGPFIFTRREVRRHWELFAAQRCSPHVPWALSGCRKWLFWQRKWDPPP